MPKEAINAKAESVGEKLTQILAMNAECGASSESFDDNQWKVVLALQRGTHLFDVPNKPEGYEEI